MSRIGKMPIPLPDKVTFDLQGRLATVTGPRGSLSRELPPYVEIAVEDRKLIVSPAGGGRMGRSMWGLTRTLVNNMVEGVTRGFSRELLVEGVGYRVVPRDARWLQLTLGFSHPILYELPQGISAEVDAKTNKIVLKGIDKEKLGLAAATLRSFRPPEPYKGKGIRYVEEQIRRKVGKAGAK